jgi:hypothetical protein
MVDGGGGDAPCSTCTRRARPSGSFWFVHLAETVGGWKGGCVRRERGG